MRVFTVRIEDETHEALKAKAEQLGVTMGELVRERIERRRGVWLVTDRGPRGESIVSVYETELEARRRAMEHPDSWDVRFHAWEPRS